MERKQVRVSLSRVPVVAIGLFVGLAATARAEGPVFGGPGPSMLASRQPHVDSRPIRKMARG